MSDTEELLRLTLRRHAMEAPGIGNLRVPGKSKVKRLWTWGLPTAVVAATAAIVLGVVWLDTRGATLHSGPATPATYQGVADLTGKDVGLALGLRPVEGTITGCDSFAVEYKDGAGFCLEGVTQDRFELMVLAKQIQGYVRDQYLLEYVQTRIAWEQIYNPPPTTDQEQRRADQLNRDLARLHGQLTRASAVPTARLVNPDLTGTAVVEALGLDGVWDPQALIVCNSDVVVHNAVRYCLDDVTDDPAERMVIGWQITGYPATDLRYEYAQAVTDLFNALETTDPEDPAVFELQERVKELKAAVARETHAQG